jgi:hypothetical protein
MSTLYLVSLFTDQVSDVIYSDGVPKRVTGNYVIRVPDDVIVKNPTSISNLLTQKYASILANNGLFGQVIYDDMLDTVDINSVQSSGVTLGTKGMNSIYDGGTLTTDVFPFTWGGPGSGPSQSIMTYEVFQYIDSDGKTTPYERSYQEVAPGDAPISVQVSFNGGANWMSVTDKNLINVSLSNQGANLVVRFIHTGTPSGRYFIGSWAVLF